MVSKIPFGIAFAVAMDALLGRDSYPGGSALFLASLLLLLLLVKALKALALGVAGDGDGSWALRPQVGMGKSPGFPSSHSCAMGFIVVAMAARGWRGGSKRYALTVVLLSVAASLVAAGRYVTSCHTVPQIVAGLLLGFLLGAAYAAAAPRTETKSAS